MLGLFGLFVVFWLNDLLWVKISILFVNLWLGFLYMMIVIISVLVIINEDLYEVVSIDGVSCW